ncbi:MAG: hypothetical protein ACYC3I_04880 [Gemmataceae bacterium]
MLLIAAGVFLGIFAYTSVGEISSWLKYKMEKMEEAERLKKKEKSPEAKRHDKWEDIFSSLYDQDWTYIHKNDLYKSMVKEIGEKRVLQEEQVELQHRIDIKESFLRGEVHDVYIAPDKRAGIYNMFRLETSKLRDELAYVNAKLAN